MAIFTAGLTAGTLTGCGDLFAQTPTNVPSAHAGITTQTQSLEKSQNLTQDTPSEQPSEQHSVWVTMANMRCH